MSQTSNPQNEAEFYLQRAKALKDEESFYEASKAYQKAAEFFQQLPEGRSQALGCAVQRWLCFIEAVLKDPDTLLKDRSIRTLRRYSDEMEKDIQEIRGELLFRGVEDMKQLERELAAMLRLACVCKLRRHLLFRWKWQLITKDWYPYSGDLDTYKKRIFPATKNKVKNVWDIYQRKPRDKAGRYGILIQAYRNLSALYSEYGDIKSASDSYVRSMKYQQKLAWKTARLYALFLWFIGWLSRYGETPWRLFWIVLGLIVFWGELYWYCEWLQYGSPSIFAPTPSTPPDLIEYLYYSLATFTTLGASYLEPNGIFGKAVVSVEVFLGYVTLGLAISVIASKIIRR